MKCAANSADAGRANVKPPVRAIRVGLAFLEVVVSAIIHHVRRQFVVAEGESSMSTDGTPRRKFITPLDSIRLDKTAISVISLHDADADDKAHWQAQSPHARLEALELMRQVMYGYDPITDRIERVFEVIERPSR
jgi:hypothetical protein